MKIEMGLFPVKEYLIYFLPPYEFIFNTPFLPDLNIQLFSFNGIAITLWDMLILLFIAWAIDMLPSPFRQIGSA